MVVMLGCPAMLFLSWAAVSVVYRTHAHMPCWSNCLFLGVLNALLVGFVFLVFSVPAAPGYLPVLCVLSMETSLLEPLSCGPVRADCFRACHARLALGIPRLSLCSSSAWSPVS